MIGLSDTVLIGHIGRVLFVINYDVQHWSHCQTVPPTLLHQFWLNVPLQKWSNWRIEWHNWLFFSPPLWPQWWKLAHCSNEIWQPRFFVAASQFEREQIMNCLNCFGLSSQHQQLFNLPTHPLVIFCSHRSWPVTSQTNTIIFASRSLTLDHLNSLLLFQLF